ncbi:MAG TPA: hypothetical protein VGN97_20375 [Mesorhizobium sp.]|jgi:hypothetical protein|nr:hypothetical protein [Mesorhizobium sp.]
MSGQRIEDSDQEEVERRRDDALRRALSTPPKPKQESVKQKEPKPTKPKREKGS